MGTVFKVVPMTELFQWPSNWQLPGDYEQELSLALTEALNRMAFEGWEYAGNYAHPQHIGAGYAIFRREASGQVRATGEIVRE